MNRPTFQKNQLPQTEVCPKIEVTVTISQTYSILHEVVYFSAAATSWTMSAFNLNFMIVFVITVNKFDKYARPLIYRVVHTGSNLMRIA